MESSVHSRSRYGFAAACAGACLLAVIAALALHHQWPQPVRDWAIRTLGGVPAGVVDAETDAAGHDHDHAADHSHADDHGHEGHVEENSLELSDPARRSIGLKEGSISLSTFHRMIDVPGMVVERRGRSRFTIIAPMTGYLTRILVTEGEAVMPDQPIFEIRLTHEELVQLQADLLRTTAEVDVVRRARPPEKP